METKQENITVLTPASPNSRSLKTTVPMGLVKLLKLREKDRIKWDIKPENNRFLIIIEPIEKQYLEGKR
jgi:hypothetical protein